MMFSMVVPAKESRDRSYVVVAVALAAGLLIRLVLLWQMTGTATQIVDEQHYRQLAENLLAGNGFARGPGQLTSIRPPLYPGLLALVWSAVGGVDLQVVRLLQIGLALLTTVVVYLIGTAAFDQKVGRYAAAAFWLYPSFIFFNLVILTETLFTLLLVTFVYLTIRLVQTLSPLYALFAGVVLGAAALTRSVLWPLPILLCPLLAIALPGTWRRRFALPLVLLAGFAGVVTPWAVRNTRLQGTFTVVDTMGGINLRMGNYEFTPDDRMWDAVAITGERSWSYALRQEHPVGVFTEGQKEKWAQRKAIEYMRAHPVETARRSLIKFADFWGLEREFAAGVQKGLYAPPRWFAAVAAIAVVLAYACVALLGCLGIWRTRPTDARAQLLLLVPVVMITGVHTIVFGHSRYHLPLIPILCVYGAAFLLHRQSVTVGAIRLRLAGAIATCLVLVAVWVRQLAFVDFDRVREWLLHV